MEDGVHFKKRWDYVYCLFSSSLFSISKVRHKKKFTFPLSTLKHHKWKPLSKQSYSMQYIQDSSHNLVDNGFEAKKELAQRLPPKYKASNGKY